jgi:hypothetical protein
MKIRKTVLALLAIGYFVLPSCKKQSVKDDSGLDRLIKEYHLTPGTKQATPELSFKSVGELEQYLKNIHSAHLEKEAQKTKFTARSKSGNFFYDSELKNGGLYRAIKPFSPGSVMRMNGAEGSVGCHNADFVFTETWNNYNYDGGTDMHWSTNYATNGSGQVGGVTVQNSPFGPTPDKFLPGNPYVTVNGDNIHIAVTTTQTNTVSIMGITLNSTTVTDWNIDINTCDHTSSTSYRNY